MDARVRLTINRMEEQLHRRLTVQQLAETVGLSVAQLTRLFHEETDSTPGAFLHHLRMARARILLERTTLTVGEVMAQVGIADRSRFAQEFRRQYGLTPRSLRIQLRGARPSGACG